MDDEIEDFNNTSRLTTLRFWLIKLLAGRSVIMMNAHIDIIFADGSIPFKSDWIDGGYFNNCSFPQKGMRILKIDQQ
jgi:hypothetical protein